MANSYTRIHIHYITAVKYRANLLPYERHEALCKYIAGIARARNCACLAVNHVSDHLHALMSLHPSVSVAKLIQEVKANSSSFIKVELGLPTFTWQRGYCALSYARSQIPTVTRYIERQQEHHRKEKFSAEYVDFLAKFDVDYDEQYLFDFYE